MSSVSRGSTTPRRPMQPRLELYEATPLEGPELAAAARGLLDLFGAARDNGISWVKGSGEDKSVTTLNRALTPEDFVRHLGPHSLTGPGSIGFFLVRRGASALETRVLALDFDKGNPRALQTMVDTLEARGIHPYTTCGSSGRGHHLYIFLAAPLALHDAWRALKALAAMAEEAGFDKVELRPSNGHSRGMGLLAPYKGAAADGLGSNPIRDPLASDSPVPIRQLESIDRTAINTVLSLIVGADNKCAIAESPTRSPTAPPPQDAERRWRVELERLASSWTKDRRQLLAFGAAAFGVRGLKLDPARVKHDLMRLAAEHDDEELAKRQVAIEQTFARHAEGRLVAWRQHYTGAGLEPPSTSSGQPAPLPLRVWLLHRLTTGTWHKRTGLTDMAVYAALVRRGLEHGRLEQHKLLVSVDVRTLAEEANVSSSSTRQKALKRLKDRHLIAPVDGWRRDLTDAGAFVILSPADLEPVDEAEARASALKLDTLLDTVLHPAFRERYLSRAAGCALGHLAIASQPITPADLARDTGLSSETMRKVIYRLMEEALVVALPGGQVTVGADVLKRLDNVANRTGATARRDQQHEEARLDREVYRLLLLYRAGKRAKRGSA